MQATSVSHLEGSSRGPSDNIAKYWYVDIIGAVFLMLNLSLNGSLILWLSNMNAFPNIAVAYGWEERENLTENESAFMKNTTAFMQIKTAITVGGFHGEVFRGPFRTKPFTYLMVSFGVPTPSSTFI